jgi:S1-C subfamily serine protease
VTYSLDKIFPNEFEPPPNKASSGSGIIVSKQGHIITNKHVVQKQNYVFKNHPERWVIEESLGFPDSYSDIATSITASIGGVNYNLAPVICYDQSSGNLLIIPEDLIILKILNPPSTIKFTVLDNSANNLGDEVYTLGFPLSSTLGSRMIYSNGYFSSESIEFDIYNMSINPGNSGGGIFDKKTGNCVGIKTEGICFGTRLNSLSEIVKSSNTKFLNLSKYSDNTGKWKWVNSELGLAYTKSAFSMLVRDNTFKPSITVENNRAATVQIIAQ